MSEVIAPLTNDEITVLMIAAEGQFLLPVGRWEKPIRALAQRGLLGMLDEFNYVITPTGRSVCAAAEHDAIRAVIAASNGVAEERDALPELPGSSPDAT